MDSKLGSKQAGLNGRGAPAQHTHSRSQCMGGQGWRQMRKSGASAVLENDTGRGGGNYACRPPKPTAAAPHGQRRRRRRRRLCRRPSGACEATPTAHGMPRGKVVAGSGASSGKPVDAHRHDAPADAGVVHRVDRLGGHVGVGEAHDAKAAAAAAAGEGSSSSSRR